MQFLRPESLSEVVEAMRLYGARSVSDAVIRAVLREGGHYGRW